MESAEPIPGSQPRKAQKPHYQNSGTFTGGTILGVAVDVNDVAYLDMEHEAARAFSLD
jgi:hypothetical protein